MSTTPLNISPLADAGDALGGKGAERNSVLTHSSEQAWKTCPRKFYLQYELGLRPAHDSEALRLGASVHIGLEAIKNGGNEDAGAKAVRGAYADTQWPPYLSPEEFQVEEETAVAIVRAWYRRWHNDLICEYIAVEIGFELPIINPDTGRPAHNFTSAGKIDGIVRLPDGRIALLEHKTTSESLEAGSDYWNRLLMDSQISRYVVAARKKGFDVATTIYDVIRKPQIRPKNVAKADRAQATYNKRYFDLELTETCPERETPKMFGARVLADMCERPDFYFARNEIPRLDHDLEEFTREQWTIQRSIRASQLDARTAGAAAWPRNTGACLSPYRCQFFDVCRGLNGNPTDEIPQGFRRAERRHEELCTTTGAES